MCVQDYGQDSVDDLFILTPFMLPTAHEACLARRAEGPVENIAVNEVCFRY